jgi:hypothetical protein
MAITNGYCTLAQVKAGLRITDSVDDTLLEMAVESASRAIDSYCNRVFYSTGTAVVRYYSPQDSYLCDIDDLVSLTSLYTNSDETQSSYNIQWTSEDRQLEPLNGLADGQPTPFTRIRAIGEYTFQTLNGEASVKVTGVFGYSAVPIAITQATVIQSSRIYKRLDSPLGIISGELGTMRVGTRLDPDVAQLVDGFRKVRMG